MCFLIDDIEHETVQFATLDATYNGFAAIEQKFLDEKWVNYWIYQAKDPDVSRETTTQEEKPDPRKIYAELESILPVYPGSPSAGELAEIRRWIFAEDKDPETALLLVWGHELHMAPLGLFPLIRPEMELGKLPIVAERLRKLEEGDNPLGEKFEKDLLEQIYRQNRVNS